MLTNIEPAKLSRPAKCHPENTIWYLPLMGKEPTFIDCIFNLKQHHNMQYSSSFTVCITLINTWKRNYSHAPIWSIQSSGSHCTHGRNMDRYIYSARLNYSLVNLFTSLSHWNHDVSLSSHQLTYLRKLHRISGEPFRLSIFVILAIIGAEIAGAEQNLSSSRARNFQTPSLRVF